MTRRFKVPVDAPSVLVDAKEVGPLADTGTPAALGTADRGSSTQSARSDHAHRTNVVYSTDAPAATDVIWVDTDAVASGGSGGAPTDATYVVTSSNATLTNERVLTAGSFVTVTDNGSSTVTLAVDASTTANGKVVARDASGNFSAGTITAALTGNASTATTLQTSRNINGTPFNGSADITVTAAAGTLTGTTLNSTVTASSLTSFGSSPTIATPALTLSTTTSTTEGRIAWDATNDQIEVGTGTALAEFGALGSTNGAALGTAGPGTSGQSARADHVHPTTGVGLTASPLSQFAATTSAQLAGVVSDETGSGALVFGTSPTLTTPVITQDTATPSFSSNSYTVTTGDEGKMLLASNSTTAGSVKIPTNATTAFAVGTQIHIIQTGSGQLTISAVTSGTTSVLSAGATAASPKLRAQYSAATMLKTATDTWYVFGDIA